MDCALSWIVGFVIIPKVQMFLHKIQTAVVRSVQFKHATTSLRCAAMHISRNETSGDNTLRTAHRGSWRCDSPSSVYGWCPF